MKIDNFLKLLREFDKSLVFKIAEVGANSYNYNNFLTSGSSSLVERIVAND